ncbi:ABC transporter permease [Aeromicrobium phragmitis]|uniref:Transport permease protein n=1 Tax=Aeromicrobium phragmitis TaxID=2478914 RepID=A0A3L8PQQ0_9ACTN|nr:ABC transporter permease [Aeromicrobium phragmitis]RLV56352.1 ABC transporter permease [Aeromicrobium phragmitis]
MTRTFAMTRRVLQQLSHDPRSIVLILAMPSVLLLVFRYVYDSQPQIFDRIGPQMIGLFPFVIMFLVTSVTMVRERTSGTLERLLTTPLARGELIGGYALAFAVAALAQAALTTAFALGVLNLDIALPWALLAFAVLGAVVGTALGLLASAFARTEFQAVQFMPLVIVPQILLCGLLIARDQMPDVLYGLSWSLPLSYATDAFTELATSDAFSSDLLVDLLALVGFALAAILGASLTLRRRSA